MPAPEPLVRSGRNQGPCDCYETRSHNRFHHDGNAHSYSSIPAAPASNSQLELGEHHVSPHHHPQCKLTLNDQPVGATEHL